MHECELGYVFCGTLVRLYVGELERKFHCNVGMTMVKMGQKLWYYTQFLQYCYFYYYG